MSQSRGDTNATVMRRARTPRDGRRDRTRPPGEGPAPESGYNQFVEELVNRPDFGHSVGGNGQSTEFYSCSNTLMFSDLRGQRQDRPSQPELVEQAEAPGAVIIASQRLQRPIIAKATLL